MWDGTQKIGIESEKKWRKRVIDLKFVTKSCNLLLFLYKSDEFP